MIVERKTHPLVSATAITIVLLGAVYSARAQTCAPPPGFVDQPHPTVSPSEQLVAHTEEITVAHSLTEVLDAGAKTSLKDAIHKAGSLPGVIGDYPLGNIAFPTPGARRLVCLSDGSTLQEQ